MGIIQGLGVRNSTYYTPVQENQVDFFFFTRRLRQNPKQHTRRLLQGFSEDEGAVNIQVALSSCIQGFRVILDVTTTLDSRDI